MADYSRYLAYFNNTGGATPEQFDDDYEPIGEVVRKAMLELDLIKLDEHGFLHLTPAGRRQLNAAMGEA